MATLLFFASIRERMGQERLELPVEGEQTVGDLLRQAARIVGKKEEFLLAGSLRYALNHTLCEPDDLVGDDDEVAVLPPLSGGIGKKIACRWNKERQ